MLATINDKKLATDDGNGEVAWYEADVVTANDYYPFGMGMPGRKYAFDDSYRYGFNGKENDNDIKGEGNQQDYGMRIYDPRLGRFLSVDPLTKDFPWYTPYQFAGNTPIQAIDLDGLEEQKAITITEEKIGETKLKVAWKEGNGKVVQMVSKQSMSKSAFVRVAQSASLLSFIWEFFTSPTTSPQEWAKTYPGVGSPQEEKFWEVWTGPGRRFPLPPSNPAELPQWLSDYWPEDLPVGVPTAAKPQSAPTSDPSKRTNPNPQAEPVNDSDADDENSGIASVRFQVQQGKANISSLKVTNNEKIGVTKAQGYNALNIVYQSAITSDPSLADNKGFKKAIIKVSQQIKAVKGGLPKGGNQTTIKATFDHKGKDYRIDLEVQRGINFKI